MTKAKIFKGHVFPEDIEVLFNTPVDNANSCSTIFGQAYLNWHRALIKTVEPFELTVPQWMALNTFMFMGSPLSPSEIGRRLPIEATSISKLLAGLEKRSLIKRRRSNTDMRAVQVFITDVGLELLKKVEPRVIEQLNYVFGSFSANDRKLIIRLLRKIRNNCITWNKKNPQLAELIFKQLTERNYTSVDKDKSP
jgi:MarR family transcriptional regulator for hemolysin